MDYIDRKEAKEYLRSQGISGTEEELSNLIDRCGVYYREPLKCITDVLITWADAQAGRISEPAISKIIVESLLTSGYLESAIRLYYATIQGGFIYTGMKQGEFEKALCFLELFEKVSLSDIRDTNRELYIPYDGIPQLKHEQALFLIELGKLEKAENTLRELAYTDTEFDFDSLFTKSCYTYIARENLCDVLTLRGKLVEAEQISGGLVQAYQADDFYSADGDALSARLFSFLSRGEFTEMYSFTTGANPFARRGLARSLQGKVRDALTDFKLAEDFQQRKLQKLYTYRKIFSMANRYEKEGGPKPDLSDAEGVTQPLTGQAAVHYAKLLTRLGKLNSALRILAYSREWAAHPDVNWPGIVAYTELALSDVYRLMADFEQAEFYLANPLRWAADTGQQEIGCWGHLAKAQLKLLQNHPTEAQSSVYEAHNIAAECHLKLYEIDCNVTAGRIALLQDDLELAHARVVEAMELSADPDCAYGWGHGNALHLLGEIAFKEDDLEVAHMALTGAAKLRKRIEDPRLLNTLELLEQIPDTVKGE